MARKKRVYSTKKKSTARRVTVNESADVFVNKGTIVKSPLSGSVRPKAEPDPEPKDPRLTLNEAIEWFRKDPHEEVFFCPETPGFALASGNHYLKFRPKPNSTGPGYFRTSDPVEVEILMRAREFNLFYFAVNPVLRNLK
jgi:hypothetical protein